MSFISLNSVLYKRKFACLIFALCFMSNTREISLVFSLIFVPEIPSIFLGSMEVHVVLITKSAGYLNFVAL